MNARLLRKSILALALVFVAASAINVQAAGKQKEIRVEEGSQYQNDDVERLKVDFKATKAVFRVDEPISFKIRSNRQVYVYVFTMHEDQQKAVQIFPNKYDKANLLRPGKAVTMPSRKSVFKSDSVGTEQLILIASEKKLNLQHNDRSEGSFYDMEWKGLSSAVKTIRVESGEGASTGRGGKIVKELDIIIKSN